MEAWSVEVEGRGTAVATPAEEVEFRRVKSETLGYEEVCCRRDRSLAGLGYVLSHADAVRLVGALRLNPVLGSQRYVIAADVIGDTLEPADAQPATRVYS